MRLLILCTHNSARSQMTEGWTRHLAREQGLDVQVYSAGTEKTAVKPETVTVMREVGIDVSSHFSKTLLEVPDPWNFNVVLTVCDNANETCPAYPAKTQRLHVSFPDPSGQPLARWRAVRDALGATSRELVTALNKGEVPTEAALRGSA